MIRWSALIILAVALSGDARLIAAPPRELDVSAANTQPAPDTTTAPPVKSSAQELDEFLQLLTGNNTPEARELGARSLLRNGADEAARRLIDVLKSSNDSLAKSAICKAIQSVERPHPSLLDPLLLLMGRNPPELARMIPAALRRFDPGVVIPKLRSLAGDASLPIEQRNAAITALGDSGDDLRSVQALLEIINDGPDTVRGPALDALSDVAGARVLDANAARAWWESHKSMGPLDWLREMNQRRTDEIQRMKADRETLLNRLVTAYRESYFLTPEIDQPQKLLAFLRDDSGAVRGLALDLINGLITDRKEISQDVRQQLLKLVTDVNPTIRRRAAYIVGDLRPAGSADRLRNALAVELDPLVRCSQVNALGRLDDADSIPVLIARLDDPSKAVVGEAASALGLLSRRLGAHGDVSESVAAALVARYERIGPESDDLREKFLEAMGRILSESFRPLFIAEMEQSRTLRVRSAAIAAFSGCTGASEHIRKYVTAPEPDIRLAVVQSLGRCGRGRDDLDALAICLDATQEPNQAVRERAWESYLTIFRRLPAREQIELANRFDRPNDPGAQRRRADLMNEIRNAPERTEPLTQAQRFAVLDALASSLATLKEYSAEVAALEEAVSLATDPKSPPMMNLRLRLLAALLHAGQDKAAMDHLLDYCKASSSDEGSNCRTLIQAVVSELEARLTQADVAIEYTKLLELLNFAMPVLSSISPDASNRLDELRAATLASRQATIDRLLDSITTDEEVEASLLAFSPDVVLPEVLARLARGGADRLLPDEEPRLVNIAKKMAAGWTGYNADASEDDRRASLEALQSFISSGTTTTQPASRG